MEKNKIYLGDCVKIMDSFKEESVDLIFADPPFNIGLKYDVYDDKKSYDEYFKWSEEWISSCIRILKRTGSIYIAIGDEFAAEINIILKKIGFNFRNWIVWYYTFGQNQKKKFNRSHTHILYFTKDKEHFYFDDNYIRIPSARQLLYNDKRANPNGKIPDDVWEFSRVCGTFKERIGNHPCQMPEKLLERIIKASSKENDLVLDPFGGTGTTAAVAKRLKRNYVTMDISKKYFTAISNRLNDMKNTKFENMVEYAPLIEKNEMTLFDAPIKLSTKKHKKY
ncbi:MAG: site-specific DNA-methyltransferase [Ignavibacteriae bacterium]|nr:site-specific DNA-methyltransferase [Ignavibacteriota bacterium]